MEIEFGRYNLSVKREMGREYIYDIIRKKWMVLTSEEEVRQLWLHYLVYDLKISPAKIAVEKGFKINDRIKRFDICVFNHEMRPNILFECKSPTIKLSQNSWSQLSIYNINLKCDKFIITNGLTHIGLRIVDKELRTIDKMEDFFV